MTNYTVCGQPIIILYVCIQKTFRNYNNIITYQGYMYIQAYDFVTWINSNYQVSDTIPFVYREWPILSK